MRTKTLFASLLFGWLALNSLESNGQSLRGKVIYVSSSQDVILKFRSGISNYDFSPKESASLFGKRLTNKKNLSLSSTVENFPSTRLIIIEGDNTHLFLLEYKDKLDPKTETIYDFSSKDLLRSEASKLDAGSKDTVAKQTTPDNEVKLNSSTQEHKPSQKEIEDKFNETKIKANQAYSGKKYDEAKALYLNALELKPDDLWCKNQLENIEKIRTAGKLEDQQKSIELSFQNHLRVADSAFNAKAYDVAKFEYGEALGDRPGDQHAKSQLSKIDQQLKDDEYKSYMAIALDALQNQLFDNATSAFNEALKVKPNDSDAKKGLMKVNSSKAAFAVQKQEEQIRSGKEKQFNDTVNLANNMFEAGLYAEAKSKYVKAGKMKPGEPYVQQRISEIDSIMVMRKAEMTRKKQDSLNAISYRKEIEKANKAFENKDYAKAKTSFQMAQKLSPAEKYPAERISTIDVLLLQMEEQKKAEAKQKAQEEAKNKQYNFSIKQGSAAMSKNDYLVARGFYLQAQQLKPEEKIPVSQLQVIEKKLMEIRNNERYETFAHYGDSSYLQKDYKSALRWYDSARLLKPDATYPKKQIIAVNQELLLQDELARKQKRTEEFEIAKADYDRGDALMKQQKYGEAYTSFSAFLSKVDTLNIEEYQRYQQHSIDQAKEYLTRLERYKPKPKLDTVVAPIEDDNNKKKKKKKNKDTGAIFRNNESGSNAILISNIFYQGTLKRQKLLYQLVV